MTGLADDRAGWLQAIDRAFEMAVEKTAIKVHFNAASLEFTKIH